MANSPVNIPFVDLAAQQRKLAAEIGPEIQRVLERCDFVLGEAVGTFELHFSECVKTRHAVGVSNGLDALRLALIALDIRQGDEVILPANTFIATALAVASIGARPVLVDCDAGTYNIDPNLIKRAIGSKTRAIIPVHLTGQAVDMDPILELGVRHHLHVIEDAAQAHGTLYKGRSCGSLGTAACFSFYPGKNLGAYGDGGMITTNDPAIAGRLKRLRNYGQSSKYEHVEQGINARLDTIQAAILDVKLRHLPDWNATRVRHAERYRQLLHGIGDIGFQQQSVHSTHNYHLFVIETGSRNELQAHLTESGVSTGIHYPKPIHLQKAFTGLGYKEGAFPVSELLAKRMLSLPMFPELANHQIDHVADSIRRFFSQSGPRDRSH